MYFMCYSRRAQVKKMNNKKREKRYDAIRVFRFITIIAISIILLLLLEYFLWHPTSNGDDDDYYSATDSNVLKSFFFTFISIQTTPSARVNSFTINSETKILKTRKIFVLRENHSIYTFQCYAAYSPRLQAHI